ncbi:catabolite repressor/activator [Halomonas sp. GD1P12]|uniref:catabolite repressor/activator n=1 Tax=Halomonas sp. GD1P12 TaxID=2982691 RepID=UPI0021E4EA46|nr:catabolite repressor/activator [Halomonas sp. GD1P12]UYG01208.1 catabolite repressor/activator [Halomonas sp. GD1P12]
MTLADIARLAGVSRTTASYVINGQAEQRRISAATIEKVMSVVRAHRYHVDPQAAALRRGASRVFGLIVPDLENASYARLAKRLERGAREKGYQLLVVSSDDCPDSERQLALALRARRCDVLITASCLSQDDLFYLELARDGARIVGVDRGLSPSRFASVVSDDFEAARELTRSVIDEATRRILWMEAMPGLSISRDRRAGFEAALAERELDGQILCASRYERGEGAELLAAFERENAPVDAIVTASYTLLEGVFDHYLAKGGLSERVRLATFGDHRLLDFLPQPVNTVAQDHDAMARRVLACALDAIEGRAQTGQQVVPRQLRTR